MVMTAMGTIVRYRMRALGTLAEVVVSDAGLTGAAAALLEDGLDWIDRLASRFRDDSELSRLNASAGHPYAGSPDLIEVLEVAVRAARLTDGLVTPTVGAALCAIGYDRDFDAMTSDAGTLPGPVPVPDWRELRIDAATGSVELRAGTVIDLGATAKAWAADRIAESIAARLDCGVLVSLGGDISVSGPAPTDGWTVAVADRCVDEPNSALDVVSITGGGLATSGTATRTWQRDGRVVHHLIDPRSGLSAPSCWTSVTVAAGTCVDANTAATAAMILGADGPRWLESRSLPALLVPDKGAPKAVAGWPEPEGI